MRSSSLASSKPSSTAEMSTFLRHAFFPLREDCLGCVGAPSVLYRDFERVAVRPIDEVGGVGV